MDVESSKTLLEANSFQTIYKKIHPDLKFLELLLLFTPASIQSRNLS